MIYNEINNFCKVRNLGNCFRNGPEPTPRVQFLMKLLESKGIEYELDAFEEKGSRPVRRPRYPISKGGRIARFFDMFDDESRNEPEETYVNKYFNIIMRGTSNKMVVAHHDVNNASIDNANDNSASVINVIATKLLRPDVNAVLLDGEEFGGIGSNHLARQIKAGEFGTIEWVLNYELTGKGGKYFFIGAYPGRLSDKITGMFDCPIVHTPFNDSVILRKYGIDSVVINPVPPMPDGKESDVVFADGTFLDTSILYNCHSTRDNLASISVNDMKEFVEKVILKILA